MRYYFTLTTMAKIKDCQELWLIPVISAHQEAEIGRITGQPKQKVSKTPSQSIK
jgi:hypothetical protein